MPKPTVDHVRHALILATWRSGVKDTAAIAARFGCSRGMVYRLVAGEPDRPRRERPRGRRRVDPAAILDMATRGWHGGEIAAQLGCSRAYVSAVLKRAGQAAPRPGGGHRRVRFAMTAADLGLSDPETGP